MGSRTPFRTVSVPWTVRYATAVVVVLVVGLAGCGSSTNSSGGGGGGGGGGGTGGTGGISFGHCGARTGRYFPGDSWIYQDISLAPARSNSAQMTKWLEDNGSWNNDQIFQIDNSFVIVDADGTAPRVASIAPPGEEQSSDCDPDLSVPLPPGGRIEGSSDYVCSNEDCHLIVVDLSDNILYEAYQASYTGGKLYNTCTVAWDMTRDVWGTSPANPLPDRDTLNWGIGRGCTGPDAAGFPIAPLLFTVGDVLSGKVEHVIRFALPNSRIRETAEGLTPPVFVWPATHAGGPEATDPDAPIYGTRWRLRDSFNPADRGLDPNNPVVIAVVYGLKKYGMILADGTGEGGIPLMAENADDCATTWDDLWGEDGSRVLGSIKPTDFDVLDSGGIDGDGWECQRNPARN